MLCARYKTRAVFITICMYTLSREKEHVYLYVIVEIELTLFKS